MAGGLSFCSFIRSLPPLFPSLSQRQAQNTQQTGFKGNLRLLLQTLEQPHLPFKILPAALSHRLHTERLLMLAASTAFHFTPSSPRTLGKGGHAADFMPYRLKKKKQYREERKWKEVGVCTCFLVMQTCVKKTKALY